MVLAPVEVNLIIHTNNLTRVLSRRALELSSRTLNELPPAGIRINLHTGDMLVAQVTLRPRRSSGRSRLLGQEQVYFARASVERIVAANVEEELAVPARVLGREVVCAECRVVLAMIGWVLEDTADGGLVGYCASADVVLRDGGGEDDFWCRALGDLCNGNGGHGGDERGDGEELHGCLVEDYGGYICSGMKMELDNCCSDDMLGLEVMAFFNSLPAPSYIH